MALTTRQRPGPRRRAGRPPAQRGVTAVLVAILVTVLGGFLALALNIGHFFSIRGELQNAVDSAALAGAKQLDGTVAQLQPALDAAASYASQHLTDSHLQVTADQVELGHWAPPSQSCSTWGGVPSGQDGPLGYQFCRIDTRDAASALNITAVRVDAARAQGTTGGGAVPVFMNGVLGASTTTNERTEAVAVSGGPCQTACPSAPLVINAGCLVANNALTCGSTYFIGLSSTVANTAGWTSLSSTTNVNNQSICNILQSGSGSCSLSTGETINIGNGNQLSSNSCKGPTGSGISTFCDWLLSMQGQQLIIPIIGDPSTSTCSGSYTGSVQVTGFATFTVTGGWCKSSSTSTIGPCSQFANTQCISLQYVCGSQVPYTSPVGCGWWGLSPLRPQLSR